MIYTIGCQKKIISINAPVGALIIFCTLTIAQVTLTMIFNSRQQIISTILFRNRVTTRVIKLLHLNLGFMPH